MWHEPEIAPGLVILCAGTLDDPSNDDEEWVLELAIPLQATGFVPGVSQLVTVQRCDTPKDHIQRCGSWSGRVALQ